ncbi:hypothetical protein I9W82_001784 [Candida metapsilosis]|uniref:Uncharacterized protein n=1 Tax=Candida metapsilosis TaxID=273372 RepID=A0A8H7ZG34_9ASCO|nr:hypothetical protein I9W82_001784 [Candida metapsilosis]
MFHLNPDYRGNPLTIYAIYCFVSVIQDLAAAPLYKAVSAFVLWGMTFSFGSAPLYKAASAFVLWCVTQTLDQLHYTKHRVQMCRNVPVSTTTNNVTLAP